MRNRVPRAAYFFRLIARAASRRNAEGADEPLVVEADPFGYLDGDIGRGVVVVGEAVFHDDGRLSLAILGKTAVVDYDGIFAESFFALL